VLFRTQKKMGVDFTLGFIGTSGDIRNWHHFYFQLPKQHVRSKDAIGEQRSMTRSGYDVLKRGLEEITIDALDTVKELINQNALYRGDEHGYAVTGFYAVKRYFDSIYDPEKKSLFCWYSVLNHDSAIIRIRNSSIGQLLQNLSADVDVNVAVAKYEQMVAPANYKRPTALITQGMIKKAQATIEELGYASALDRRFAVTKDISINEVIFANRRAKKEMNVFDAMANDIPDADIKSLDKIQEIHIDHFIKDVLPTATALELLVENRHQANLMSLIAPFHEKAKSMFKWDNGFSWAYKGDVTDSIKERVKAAGGDVEGFLRCSLAWFNNDDLDIHMVCPNGAHIHFGDKRPKKTHGVLDVDMNAGGPSSLTPVENITFKHEHDLEDGTYVVKVNNYQRRSSENGGFELEVAFGDDIQLFEYPQNVGDKKTVMALEFEYSRADGFKIVRALDSKTQSKKIWGINTSKFHNVSLMLNSPNHWGEKKIGNKHYFFILQDCLNDEPARGFFNEFLSNELIKHKKVFEILGSKMKAKPTAQQLSGLGFSSTISNSVICRVTGKTKRSIKIIF